MNPPAEDFAYAGRGMLVDEKILITELPKIMHRYIEDVTSSTSAEKKFLAAHINPFADKLGGVRIPDYSNQ